MTRTQLSQNDPHNARKAFRAQARSQGLSYPQALAAAKAARSEFPESDASRRKNVSPSQLYNALEGGTSNAVNLEEEILDYDGNATEKGEQRNYEVNLLDIAKPARRRGRAKNRSDRLPTQGTVTAAASEQWEQWTEASFGDESEVWELDSVLSHTEAEEWQELDYSEKRVEAQVSRSYSQAAKVTT
uniref:Uncharacterized protein n=1 Tax=Mycena chlorophos TaxID=658473 RepID=A0ABQ0M167_MYCCL|nr:predicted protein [Mycena chlorophos]